MVNKSKNYIEVYTIICVGFLLLSREVSYVMADEEFYGRIDVNSKEWYGMSLEEKVNACNADTKSLENIPTEIVLEMAMKYPLTVL